MLRMRRIDFVPRPNLVDNTHGLLIGMLNTWLWSALTCLTSISNKLTRYFDLLWWFCFLHIGLFKKRSVVLARISFIFKRLASICRNGMTYIWPWIRHQKAIYNFILCFLLQTFIKILPMTGWFSFIIHGWILSIMLWFLIL